MELPKSVKPAVIAAVTNALVAMPSMAGEPGKIFDFNLTLPIIATEFLLPPVILDKTIFGPVGKALDDRDALIRDQLAAVGDNSTAVADLIVRTRNAQRDPLPPARARLRRANERARAPRAFPARATARSASRAPPTLGSRMARVNRRSGLFRRGVAESRPRANRRFRDSAVFFQAAGADESIAVLRFEPQSEKEALISSARAEVAKEVAATKAKMDADIADASAKAKADSTTRSPPLSPSSTPPRMSPRRRWSPRPPSSPTRSSTRLSTSKCPRESNDATRVSRVDEARRRLSPRSPRGRRAWFLDFCSGRRRMVRGCRAATRRRGEASGD